MRRFMMRIAERLARKHKSLALVTGESVGQVASQTLAALDVTNSAVDMPVLQPLIGMDKIEIVDRAQFYRMRTAVQCLHQSTLQQLQHVQILKSLKTDLTLKHLSRLLWQALKR